MSSLLSLSSFAKNNSLGSFNGHNLGDFSNLPSVNGEEALPGLDSKGRGHSGRSKASKQFQQPQGPAGRSPRGEPGPDWGSHQDPRGFQDHPGDHRSHKEQEKDEGEQYTQGLFLKQLQQQRQQKHDHSHHPDSKSRDSTPPINPRHEPDQARSRPLSGDPKARDPRAAHASSPYHDTHARQEQHHEQGRADPGSPWNQQEGGRAKPSTFLSELQQAIEPALNSRSASFTHCRCHVAYATTSVLKLSYTCISGNIRVVLLSPRCEYSRSTWEIGWATLLLRPKS